MINHLTKLVKLLTLRLIYVKGISDKIPVQFYVPKIHAENYYRTCAV